MKIIWSEKSWDDYIYWQQTDKKILKKINQLIKDIKRDSFNGLEKPKSLKYELSGFWSRRISDEYRLVYKVYNDILAIASCRFHYQRHFRTRVLRVCFLKVDTFDKEL